MRRSRLGLFLCCAVALGFQGAASRPRRRPPRAARADGGSYRRASPTRTRRSASGPGDRAGIKRAFRAIARRCHPDTWAAERRRASDAPRAIPAAAAAYELLLDRDERARLDARRAVLAAADSRRCSAGPRGGRRVARARRRDRDRAGRGRDAGQRAVDMVHARATVERAAAGRRRGRRRGGRRGGRRGSAAGAAERARRAAARAGAARAQAARVDLDDALLDAVGDPRSAARRAPTRGRRGAQGAPRAARAARRGRV